MTEAMDAALTAGVQSRAPQIKKIGFEAPWSWIAAGWQDLRSAPQVSLVYGAAFSLAAFALAFALAQDNALPFLLPLFGGFLLLGPLLAIGLYDVSRRREQGLPATLRDFLHANGASTGQVALFGVLLLLVFFVWVLIAALLFMLFFGPADIPPLQDFVSTLLLTNHGLGLLIAGTVAGAALATTTYAISVISVPMLLDRPVDVVTAVSASVTAVRVNLPAMALWAALILALVALGIATLFVGLAITFPLIGHATWHAYRDIAGARLG